MISVLLVSLYCLGYNALIIQAADQGIGDECILSGGNTGRCERISECRHAQNLLKSKQDLVTCGFLGLEPIVCCNGSPTKPNPSALTRREPGDVSRKECERTHPKVQAPSRPSGNPLLAKQFPHMSIIGYEDSNDILWLCGGSLISESFVLTAAHCIFTRAYGSPKLVRIGDLDLSTDKDEARPQNFTVKRVIAHPDYKPPIKYHDIGLIELDRKAKLDIFVNTACLHTDRQLQYTKLIESGWGKTEFSADRSSSLLKANLDYVPPDICRRHYKNLRQLPNGIEENTQICAGGPSSSDTCLLGDSGGPLQVLDINRTDVDQITYHIVGITSFGKACTSPAVYTRVAYYVPWIESIVWPDETL